MIFLGLKPGVGAVNIFSSFVDKSPSARLINNPLKFISKPSTDPTTGYQLFLGRLSTGD